MIKAEPQLLFYEGVYLHPTMKSKSCRRSLSIYANTAMVRLAPILSERRADAAVLTLGAGLVIPAMIWLLVRVWGTGDVRAVWAAVVYAVGAAATFILSAAYNLALSTGLKARLRPFDHAAIYLMIAGTYTPFTLVALDHGWAASGQLLLTFVWIAAFIGMAIKILAPGRWDRAGLAAYLVLGWCILPLSGALYESMAICALLLMVAGGVFYSTGVAFHLAKQLRFQDATWHSCVLAGATCHYVAIWNVLSSPAELGGV